MSALTIEHEGSFVMSIGNHLPIQYFHAMPEKGGCSVSYPILMTYSLKKEAPGCRWFIKYLSLNLPL